jgi:acyl carrier protein
MTPESVVARVFGQNAADIDDSTSPDTLPEWDSLGQITLIIELESAFGVSFSPDESVSLNSVGAIKAALATRGR